MTKRQEPLPRHALAAFLEGEVTPSEAAVIEAHLRDSGSARRHLEQLDAIRQTLARMPADVDQDDRAVAELWRTIDAPPVAAAAPRVPRIQRWQRSVRAGAWLGATACAAVAVVWLARGAPAPALSEADPGELRAKSAAAFPEDRWVRIEILRVAADGSARPLPGRDAVVRAREQLVVRYLNGGADPFGFLMVLAVDAAGQIHWYYPAYEAAGSDPSSTPIRVDGRGMYPAGSAAEWQRGSIDERTRVVGDGDATGVAGGAGGDGARGIDSRMASLPDAIEHELRAGPLVFYGVFTRVPLHVLDVERRVSELVASERWSADLPPRLPIEGAGQHVVRATVVP